MGSTRKAGLGIIGCGSASRLYHAPAIANVDSLQAVALYDPVPQAAHELGALLPQAALAPSVDEMLANPRIHAVAILTPPATHYELAAKAIAAGKHVLVEKPLTLHADQAAQLQRLAAESGLVCAVGFHLRNHRHVQSARAAIRRGDIGRVRVARSLWCARASHTLPSNSWRRDPVLGGSLLDDVAVHHIDLLRYLLDSPLRDLRVAIDDAGEASSHVQLYATAASGASVDIAVVEGRFEWQEIEVAGERGRIQMSLYDAWGFEAITDQVPAFGLGARIRRLSHALRTFPSGLSMQLRGGDLACCYRSQWTRFAQAIFGEGSPAATFDDGAECVRVVAGAHKRASQEILLRPSETAGDSGSRSVEPRSTYGPNAGETRPPLSVVLATPDEFRSLRTTIGHLRAQTARDCIELVLVGPISMQTTAEPAMLEGFWDYRLVCVDAVHTIAQANAAGVRAARGRVIVFAEDHCFPEPGWAEALLAAHREPHAVVGPVVKNANPATWISWADFLAGYGPWMEGCTNGHPGFLPGHNSSYKREILEALGDHLEDFLEAETVLHTKLSAEGYSLHMEQGAVVAHVNFALLDSWADVQFLNGRVFAGMRCRDWGISRRLLYFLGSPLIPFVRTWRSLRPLLAADTGPGMKILTFPGLFLGMCVDGFGQMIGYAAGPGSAKSTLARLEFHRARHIPPEERRALFV